MQPNEIDRLNRPEFDTTIKETEKKPGTGLQLGVYYPPDVITNDDVATWGLTRPSGHVITPPFLERRIGAIRRHIADTNTTSLEMGVVAACLALGRDGGADFTFFTTSFPTGQSYSERLSELLGLGKSHIDVHGAGAGFVIPFLHIKQYEKDFLEEGENRVAIASGEDIQKRVVDLETAGLAKDPSMAQLIFSDGAAAFAFTYGKDLIILATAERNLGNADCLKLPYTGDPAPGSIVKPETGVPVAESGKIEHDGDTFYRVVTQEVPTLITETVTNAGLDPEKIALIIPHQASLAVLQRMQEQLPPAYAGKVFMNLEDGNFSSASIPIALAEACEKQLIKKGDIVVFAGFGAGLYSAVAIVQFLSELPSGRIRPVLRT